MSFIFLLKLGYDIILWYNLFQFHDTTYKINTGIKFSIMFAQVLFSNKKIY